MPYFNEYNNVSQSLNFQSDTPENIKTMISKNYERATTIGKDSDAYLFTGNESYSFSLPGHTLDSDYIIKNFTQDQAAVLDIGTGNGDFLIHTHNICNNVECFGITAQDFREEYATKSHGQLLDDKHYLKTNAETIDELFPNNKFDLIVSRVAFVHFTDPATDIIKYYEKLKPGAIFVVDNFKLPGCEKRLHDIIEHLKEKGYLVLVKHNNHNIESFVIQKTHPHLSLPIKYDGLKNNKANYAPLEDLKHYDLEKTFQSGLKAVNDMMKDENIPKFNANVDIYSLFNNDEFQKMDSKSQYFAILNSTTHYLNNTKENLSDWMNSLQNEINQDEVSSVLFKNISSSTNFSGSDKCGCVF